jgi:hypothetical protein
MTTTRLIKTVDTNDADASVASNVATRESISRADWSVDPRGGPTVGTKDWPIAFGLANRV